MRLSTSIVAAAAAALVVPGLLAGQRVDPTRLIDLHVNAEAQNVSFSGTVPEGGRFRLTFPDRSTYAISPVFVQGRTFVVTLLRGEGKPEDGDDQNWRPVETVQATVGRPVPLRTLRQVTVVIDGVQSAAAGTGSEAVRVDFASNAVRRLSLFGDCCVTCNGIGACGCKVEASCGSCCVAPCKCPTPLQPSTLDFRPEAARSFAALVLGRRCSPVPDDERLFVRREEQAAMVGSSR